MHALLGGGQYLAVWIDEEVKLVNQ